MYSFTMLIFQIERRKRKSDIGRGQTTAACVLERT